MGGHLGVLGAGIDRPQPEESNSAPPNVCVTGGDESSSSAVSTPMAGLPAGTVTFLFTDIEGSTRLLQEPLATRYADLLAEYQRRVRTAAQTRTGHEVDTQGDSLLIAFARAKDAVAAAVDAQRAITTQRCPNGVAVRVRMGLHTGEPVLTAVGYVGIDVHRAARICSAAHGGQVLLSQTTHDLAEHDLPEGVSLRDLGAHRLRDLQRSEHLFQVLHHDLPAEFPLLRSLDTLSHNLPVELTSFIGREREIAELKRLLGTTHLLTLTGIGGAGKTRLALQVAAEVLDTFAEGVWLVELAPLSDPGLIPHMVAAALGVREEPGRTVLESLVDFAGPKSLLLMLDNCEHVISASAHLVNTLLRACPSVRVVATTREPLGIAGELTYRVPPLSLPESGLQDPFELLIRSEAVRLFVDRATFVNPGFKVTALNGLAIAHVCRQLDGIPLAIELAAARVKVLSVEQIAARLDDRFQLLTGGSRLGLHRHQTLRAAIDWSYDLLSDKERALLRRVSVFAGGFGLDAAEAICAGHGIAPREVLDLMTQLVDKSLVLVETPAGGARYGIQETIRRYGQEKLLEAGEQTGFLARHRDWYLALAERAEPELQGPEQQRWIRQLEAEHDNLREALAFSLEGPLGEQALRLAATLWWFWHVRGYLSEGRTWLSKALAGSPGADERARARALYGAGFLAWRQGEFDQAQALGQKSLDVSRALGNQLGMASAISLLEHIARAQGDYAGAAALAERSLAMFREMGDTWGIATALVIVGNAARFLGNYARAREALEEGLELFRTLSDASGTAAALHFLGLVARDQGDYARADAVVRESLQLSRETGDTSRIAFSLHSLGLIARDQRNYAQAETLFQESLALFRELEDTWGITTALVSLGVTARLRGDDTRAAELLQESLRFRRGLGDKAGIAECLEDLAAVSVPRGDPQRAARLLGAAEALRTSIGVELPPTHQAECKRIADAARKQLGKTAFERAWAVGRRMDAEQALEEALAPALPEPSSAGGAQRRVSGKAPSLLTQREQEVAALIAQGRTNREIAAALVITEGTAANHVQHILNKLGLNSRAQIAAWAVEHGLGKDRR